MVLATIQSAFTPTLAQVQNLHNENQTLRTLLEKTQKELAQAKADYDEANRMGTLFLEENVRLNAALGERNKTVQSLNRAIDKLEQETRRFFLLSEGLQEELTEQKKMYKNLESECASLWEKIHLCREIH